MAQAGDHPVPDGAPVDLRATGELADEIDAEGVLRRAHQVMERVISLVRNELPPLQLDERGIYVAMQGADGPFTLRIEAVPLPGTVAARAYVNTTSGNHVIQLSDQAPLQQVGEYLAQELRVVLEVRRRAAQGQPPARQHLLLPGPLPIGVVPRLSDDDRALLARLDMLAAEASDPAANAMNRRQSRDRFAVALDEAGLRPRAPADADAAVRHREETAAQLRLAFVESHLSTAGLGMVRELAVPVEQLDPADARPVLQYRAIQPAPASTARSPGLHPDGTPISRQELPGALRRAYQARLERSEATLEALRAEASQGRLPRHRLMIGGGATLVARDSQMLLVNARGRWHLDPIEGIVQSADQVRHLSASGIGDPYQFAAPRQRLPLDAIRLWQDTLAARGPLLDGHAELQVDRHNRLLALLHPADGSTPVRIAVDGEPLIATGVPPEIVPGCAPAVPTAIEAISVLAEYLAGEAVPHARRAHQALLDLAREPAPATKASALLNEYALFDHLNAAGGPPVAAALQTLRASADWDHARTVAPGRVLLGDEVGNGSYDPTVADRWVIAGVGGAAIANAEIILRGNPNATVAMVGSTVPWVLENDAQYLALRRQHDAALGGDGRLATHTGHRLGSIVLATDDDGLVRPQAAHLTAEAYVACLGRVPRMPPVLDPLRTWASQHNGSTHGHLLFDADRQYLGYRLSFHTAEARHDVIVTGAASRMPPPDIFSSADIARVTTAGLYEAPPESGNVAAGFMATANQAARLAFTRPLRITGDAGVAPQPTHPPRPRSQPEQGTSR
ncbi:hypothetical protein OHB44_33380 (plasmid) [Micromonospora sp. NBC_00821]|uniref:hypothetical protein n=1 Tax=Micromonospora sp. NBC_00821 TaxID=2975977 RepID=UPI002ED2E85B|nr:hypothetical protein OHB44_33380 [Micromonospora sp. NBC_00821]